MKLYFSKGSCSLVVRILINELGLDTEFEAVNLKTKKTDTGADFFAVNPKGAVPTLQLDNGHILTENAVILQYLADTSKAYHLLPALGDEQRYHVLEWVNYTTTELHKSFGTLFNPSVPQDLKDTVFIPLLKSKFTFLNKHLEHHAYLMGDKFTLPDAYLFVMLMWASFFKIDLHEWSNLHRYFIELQKRPSIQASLTQEK